MQLGGGGCMSLGAGTVARGETSATRATQYQQLSAIWRPSEGDKVVLQTMSTNKFRTSRARPLQPNRLTITNSPYHFCEPKHPLFQLTAWVESNSTLRLLNLQHAVHDRLVFNDRVSLYTPYQCTCPSIHTLQMLQPRWRVFSRSAAVPSRLCALCRKRKASTLNTVRSVHV